MITSLSNPNASDGCKKVMEYLAETEGHGIIAGVHTQTMAQEELSHIHKITGKFPALCGFELLSYSPNIIRETADAECLSEIEGNMGTLAKAMEWAEKGGLLTFTWHWFSPLYGHDKSFFSKNTDFDAEKAIKSDTKEHMQMCSDLDRMAELLKPFNDKDIPILWRPFHESEGDWFWWSAKGPETAKKLFCFEHDYFTKKHHLNNLIWVWNSPQPEGYVGDDYCDIISRDTYPNAHEHGDFRDIYESLIKITPSRKGAAIAETGVLPDPDALSASHTPWLWFMTWSREFTLTEKYTDNAALKKFYNNPYTITLDRLPEIY